MLSSFDIVGPIMVGPSSSHTVGALRIAKIARQIVGKFSSVKIMLHGSFASTGGGHGTDKALLAGLMDFPVDDERIRNAEKLADAAGLKYSFEIADLGADRHPNSVRMMFSSDEGEFCVEGASIGGGEVRITKLNEIHLSASFSQPTLVVKNDDKPGALLKIIELVADAKANMHSVSNWAEEKHKSAITVIELDHPLGKKSLERLNALEVVQWARYVDVNARRFE